MQRAIKISLRDIGISPGDFDLRRLRFGLLHLHAAIDHREHLPCLHPITSINGNAQHLPAFADHAHRHRPPRGERAGRFDFARYAGLAGSDDCDRGGLRIIIANRHRLSASNGEIGRNRQQ